MKRFMCGLLVGVMTLSCAPMAFAKSKITVNVDKDELVFDVEPQIINDRLMVPMRVIFEKLKAKVDYIEAEKAVVAIKGNKLIRFVINSDYMEITDGNADTKKVALDSPATIIDGRTLVPARAVAESFGCGVSWDGNTKTVQINTDGSIAKPEQKKEKWVVTKETYYWDGNEEYRSEYEYDGAGNKTQENRYAYYYDYGEGSTKFSLNKCKFEYDSAGNQTKNTWYYEYGTVWNEYQYDSKGNAIKETTHSYDGTVYETVFEYDSNGNITREISRYSDGSVYEFKYDYTYDSKGNRVSGVRYYNDGRTTTAVWMKYEYDGAGNLKKETEEFSDGRVYEYKYEYNSDGNLKKKTAYENGYELSRTEYEYTKITIK